jgi:hypothetical protein
MERRQQGIQPVRQDLRVVVEQQQKLAVGDTRGGVAGAQITEIAWIDDQPNALHRSKAGSRGIRRRIVHDDDLDRRLRWIGRDRSQTTQRVLHLPVTRNNDGNGRINAAWHAHHAGIGFPDQHRQQIGYDGSLAADASGTQPEPEVLPQLQRDGPPDQQDHAPCLPFQPPGEFGSRAHITQA